MQYLNPEPNKDINSEAHTYLLWRQVLFLPLRFLPLLSDAIIRLHDLHYIFELFSFTK